MEKAKFTKAIFSIDAGNSEEHIGYHIAGDLWNGWGNPSFEKDVAEKVTEEFNKVFEEYGDPCDRFEWDDDTLFVVKEGESYRIDPEVIEFEGKKITVYAIGNREYCWWIEPCEICDGQGKRSHNAKYINGDMYHDAETLDCDKCNGTGYKKP